MTRAIAFGGSSTHSDILSTNDSENLTLDNVSLPQYRGLRTRFSLALGSIVIGTCFVLLICWAFGPLWETNDDVGMSMIAGGYGLATHGSTKLIFSNVLWGGIVRLIPTIGRTPGYSIAALAILILVTSSVVYAMRRLGLIPIEAVVVIVLLLARPILLPQFTINAGMLALVAVAFWCIYGQFRETRFLVLGCILVVLAFWVRNTECALILLVATPLLPWRTFWAERTPKIAAVVLLSTLVGSSIIDHQAYRVPEWQAFNDLNFVRSAFTDFGAADSLLKRPDILARHGYTQNDVKLIQSWFFVDPLLAKPERLQALIRDLGPLPASKMAHENVLRAVALLWDRALLPILLVAILLAIRRPSLRLFVCWGLCAIAILIMGIIGRPAILRVYIPLISILVVAPFLVQRAGRASFYLSRWALMLMACLAVVNSFCLISDFEQIKRNAENVTGDLSRLPVHSVVVWGAALPYELAYPVLHMPRALAGLQLYGLGVGTLAPVSTAYADEKAGHGLLMMLSGKDGVPLIAEADHIAYLGAYCAEHLQGRLVTLSGPHFNSFNFGRYRCER